MSAYGHVIHTSNELPSVSKDEVLAKPFAAYMKVTFLHNFFLFANVLIRADLIVVLLKTTLHFFFFFCFRVMHALVS